MFKMKNNKGVVKCFKKIVGGIKYKYVIKCYILIKCIIKNKCQLCLNVILFKCELVVVVCMFLYV